MPCNLVVTGEDLDIDSLLSKAKLRGFSRHYKGEAMFKSKPQGKKLTRSTAAMQTSKAGFEELEKQIKETIRYLSRHKEQLGLIKETKGVDFAFLDFGINLRIDKRKVLMQCEFFPNELLQIAGELGLGVNLSIYPIDLQNTLEKRSKKAK